MNLALIIDDYLPYSTRVGAKMMHELALEFIQQGHYVTVITPNSEISEPLVFDVIDGVNVWYFRSGKIKGCGKIQRAVNESLLSVRSIYSIKKKLGPDTFDGVVYYSPSIFFGPLVKYIKSVCQCPAYLILRDLFPQWLIDDGMLNEGSLITKYFQGFERVLYRQADCIGLMSMANQKVFNDYSNNLYYTEILRNWASLEPSINVQSIDIRKELNLDNKVIYFYGGNIGHAQDMSNLMKLVQKMSHLDDAHFLFVGQGDEVELIESIAKKNKLSNFSFYGSVSQNEYKAIMAQVDIGLFSLAKNHTAHNFPGKLLGYMAQSLPILGSVNKGNDLATIVNSANAGYILENGEDEKLYQASMKLFIDNRLRRTMGKRSYELLKKEFSVQQCASKITGFLGSS